MYLGALCSVVHTPNSLFKYLCLTLAGECFRAFIQAAVASQARRIPSFACTDSVEFSRCFDRYDASSLKPNQ